MIKAIETEYNGYRFRSRLEARWAVFFDCCGVDWEYEPEGYELYSGYNYLPDFKLKNIIVGNEFKDIFVEIKGSWTLSDMNKVRSFSGWLEGNVTIPILCLGNIPKDYDDIYDYAHGPEGYKDGNMNNSFEYINGDSYGAYFTIRRGNILSIEGVEEARGSYPKNEYTVARQARFEHGEKPNFQKFEHKISIPDVPLNHYFIGGFGWGNRCTDWKALGCRLWDGTFLMMHKYEPDNPEYHGGSLRLFEIMSIMEEISPECCLSEEFYMKRKDSDMWNDHFSTIREAEVLLPIGIKSNEYIKQRRTKQ